MGPRGEGGEDSGSVRDRCPYNQKLFVVAHSNLLSVVPRSAAEQHQALGLSATLKFDLDVQPMQVNMLTRTSTGDNVMWARFREALVESVAAAPRKARAARRRPS